MSAYLHRKSFFSTKIGKHLRYESKWLHMNHSNEIMIVCNFISHLLIDNEHRHYHNRDIVIKALFHSSTQHIMSSVDKVCNTSVYFLLSH